MAESEEELKSLLMKVKEESGKVGLKLNIKKTIQLITETKRIKYLGINLSKEAKHIMRNTGLEEAQAGIKIAGRRKWQLTPVLLPGESHGGTSLVGYSPWGRRVRHD